MIKFFCDLCGGEIPLAQNAVPVRVSYFEREAEAAVFKDGKTLCKDCNNSMADWAASRRK